jgi:GNAT superfamily N-acetyltransferase
MIKTILRTPNQQRSALRFLSQDLECNLYQIELLNSGARVLTHEWSAVYQGEEMVAVSISSNRPFPGLPSGLCVPYGDPEGCHILGVWERERGGTRHILGERSAADAFFDGLGAPPTIVHCSERLFRAGFLPEEGSYLPLRPAREAELESLIPMAAQMQEEDLGYNPLEKFGASFGPSVLARILEERFLVGEIDGRLSFIIDVGTCCPEGAQVGSMFVPSEFRGQGIGVLGMRGCLKYLLPKSSVVTLVARESNIPAMKTHRKAGYTEANPFRMIIMK